MVAVVRQAQPEDAAALCNVINPIIAKGGTTAHRNPFDQARMEAHYIAPPDAVSCALAEGPEGVLGFQSLVRADPSNGILGRDWGIIASFVAPDAQGRGIGHALFEETLRQAKMAGLTQIDATILNRNTIGLGYYGKLGFTDYRQSDRSVSKRFQL